VTDQDIMIELDELTKRFPGQQEPAVDRVSMRIPRGEIVVFVGPSGCGKTTTMKLINRLIEPTSGRIILDGEDVTDVDADQLRRRIGYVIQQVGLFPHRTIADNIATVPKMLGWKKERIAERVDELLETVSMDPGEYRGRYPKELSGGQRQRVGVARAMAVDPDVMLMDEPFGAIDPITRDRLQNEFLRIQAEVRKTIVFVTHDIDEAIKMGDRIAILRDRTREMDDWEQVAQFAPPEEILSAPADGFVEDFIGAGASLKRLNLTRIQEVDIATDAPVVAVHEGVDVARERLNRSDYTSLLVLDESGRPVRWLNARDLRRPDADLRRSGLAAIALVEPNATLHDAMDAMVTSNGGCAIVVDRRGAYLGLVDFETVMAAIRSMRAEASEFYRLQKLVDEGAVR
jgi:osmoprotectant transport system ATP-binding protein